MCLWDKSRVSTLRMAKGLNLVTNWVLPHFVQAFPALTSWLSMNTLHFAHCLYCSPGPAFSTAWQLGHMNTELFSLPPSCTSPHFLQSFSAISPTGLPRSSANRSTVFPLSMLVDSS